MKDGIEMADGGITQIKDKKVKVNCRPLK